ncbi:Chaperone protein HscA [Posidoniimonas polymericola]|uniref:Chaperone protein HscA n=1 Tax=Posidoniimonas polymericola TaxID=2528002 RepID=A0A5C5XT89_9BACT|nr:hsp70 family protein [Posidoniimonas polymericola]TWT65888.1 Chaperone protein HscA [Posidoniimonas polymericola]
MSGNAQHAAAADDSPSRYVVGIDLGTSNSAVAYVDTKETPWRVRAFSAPQVVAPFEVDARETLPSAHYQATDTEAESGSLKLPWGDAQPGVAVGVFARDEGAAKPGRVITSAKSWLSHSGVDRTADLLPWQSDVDVERLSPVEASARFLGHLHDAWNAAFPGYPLAEQEVVVTLPASFDEVARELTVAAAKRAKLPRVVLLEEPQAAFYAWVYRHGADWREHASAGQKVLVCDIGGGTSDFTLIRVGRKPDSDDLQFHRVAVGNHLILGGDNLDLALARHVEQKLTPGGKLPARQWEVLLRAAQRVKETLLGERPPESVTVNVPASGAKLIGSAVQAEVGLAEARQVLVDGFLPRVDLTDQPSRRRSGFQELGLPYAADPAITRYLAAFLTAHRHTGDEQPAEDWQARGLPDPARPDIVLLNGGFFASPVLRERLLDVLSSWFPSDDDAWRPLVLENERLDLAVSQGAAYYGMVRRGEGVGIKASLARSYYVGIGGHPPRAVCLAPGNATEGQDFEVSNLDFQLALAEPVEFPLYVSSTRLVDPPGALIDIDHAELTPLPPIRTVLHTRKKGEPQTATVRLHSHLSEVGVLELSCHEIDAKRSWRLQFDVRSTTQTDLAPHESQGEQEGMVDDATLDACRESIERVFGKQGGEKPSQLMKELAQAIGGPKPEWPTSVLRGLWEMLMELEPGRRKSPAHESRWLNLAGYALRPGFGFAVDDWRVSETWRTLHGKIAFPTSRPEVFVLWRRVAGGLSRGQQLGLAESLLADVRALRRRFQGGKATAPVALDPSQSAEVWRLLGGLELLPVEAKIELGETIVELLPKRKLEKRLPEMLWALGRIGQRVPLYGPLNTLVPVDDAERWVRWLLDWDAPPEAATVTAMQLARRTDDRHRDIDDGLRERVVGWLERRAAPDHFVQLVLASGSLEHQERDFVFGESLPSGLRLGDG